MDILKSIESLEKELAQLEASLVLTKSLIKEGRAKLKFLCKTLESVKKKMETTKPE